MEQLSSSRAAAAGPEREREPEKAPAYRELEAFASMTALRAPGVDPMQRQVELQQRIAEDMARTRTAAEQTAQNTKPAGGGTYRPAPVYP